MTADKKKTSDKKQKSGAGKTGNKEKANAMNAPMTLTPESLASESDIPVPYVFDVAALEPKAKRHTGRKKWNYKREHIESVTTTVRIAVDMRELLERYLNEHEVILSVAIGRALKLLFIDEGWVNE